MDFILSCDANEDQLNLNNNKLKDILTFNNLKDVITKPTRVTHNSSSLMDPIVPNLLQVP